MSYNFDELTERRGVDSIKWDVPKGELPVRMADMNFETAPEIREAPTKRASHGIFDYTVVPDAWRDTVADWWERCHGFVVEEDWLAFTTGVVLAISSAVRKLATIGGSVLVQTPAYNISFRSTRNNGRSIIENQLLYDGANYRIGWKDLEKKLSEL